MNELFDGRNLRGRIERIEVEHRRCTIGLCWQAAFRGDKTMTAVAAAGTYDCNELLIL
ncbi:hypothetical protein OLZ29_35255 [Rhizobium sp. 1AS13]|uniref:hypothetical protein n=1 Tax=Rhizobium acaciae TaxID=2989736 RepID=UPI002223CD88|nr:hypothetical protein [Rhizobium acaciae]MCW1413481.1 hypothetical protein [Rhizobium acaciae]